MSSPAPAPALVLSATPPLPEARAFFVSRFGADVVFADLASLRRRGIRAFRRSRAATIVVTGSETELSLFGDYLVVLAFIARGARRERAIPGRSTDTLEMNDLVRSTFRVLAGLLLGCSSVASSWWRARRFATDSFKPQPLHTSARCLYLKPTLSFGASVGGSVAHVAGVANALARSGVAVRLLTSQEQPLVEPPCTQRRVPLDFPIAFPFEVNSLRYEPRFLRAAREEAARETPGFIYQRYALNDLSGVRLREALGIPLVLEFNGSEVWAQRHWGERLRLESLSEAIERVCLRHADLVTVVSQPLVEQAAALGAAPERVLFYPNGIDPAVFDPARFADDDRRRAREALGVPADADLLTFVGTFGTWHGTDVLAAAIRRLIDGSRSWLEQRRTHFLYVGDGALAARVREILGGDLGHPFVTLAGLRPQAETPLTLAASDILLSPHVPNMDGTPFFGSPTKLFEYMAMAKPIVASELDQIGWVLKGWRPGEAPPDKREAGRTRAAVLVEPGSVDSLVAGLRQAVEMADAARATLGAEARRLVTQCFTWDRNVAAVLERLRGATPRVKDAAARENPNPA